MIVVGRTSETAHLDRFVDDLLSRTGAGERSTLVVHGEVGSGRSTLLALGARRAHRGGAHVLSVGAPGEEDDDFAGLARLLAPVTDLDGLLADAGTVGDTARGGGGRRSERPSTTVVALAVLRVLHRVARHAPVLVVVDDVELVDRHSLDVLVFLARRARAEDGVAVLLAAVEGGRTILADASLPRMELGRLSWSAASELLDTCPGRPRGGARRALLRRSEGNPGAVVELAWRAARGTDDAGSRLHAFGEQLRGLPASTRRLLLLAAAGPDDPLVVVQRASGQGADLSGWAPAEHRGLVRVDPAGVSFVHPLVRVACCVGATAAQRSTAHLDLAAAGTDDGRAAWHRARARDGADDDLAGGLEHLAAVRLEQGDAEAAVDALERSVACSSDEASRVRRHVAALRAAHLLGDLEWIEDLHAGLLARTDAPEVRAAAAGLAVSSAMLSGRHAAAFRLLEDALRRTGSSASRPDVVPLLVALHGVATRSGLPAHEASIRRWTASFPPASEDGGCGGAAPDRHAYERAAAALLDHRLDPAGAARALDGLPDRPHGGDGPAGAAELSVRGALARQAHDVRRCVELFRRAHAASRSRGLSAHTAGAFAEALVDHGLWQEADDVVADWREVAGTQRMTLVLAQLAAPRAELSALRGDADAAEAMLAAAHGLVDPGENLGVEIAHRRAHAILAATRGVPGEGFVVLRGAFTADGSPRHPDDAPPLVALLAAAASDEQERTDASAVVSAVRGAVGERPSARMRRVIHHATALLATGPAAERGFRLAVADPAGEDWPVERATARWHYGRWLFQRRRPVEARSLLSSALGTFTELGARAPAAHVRAELRAAGGAEEADRPTGTSSIDILTSQERDVVALAVQGLRNREIGERLFLSPRTVGSHLHHAYRKLGITGRRQLDQVVPDPVPAGGGTPGGSGR